MEIRRATSRDLVGVHSLLSQVLTVHAEGRPDLFRAGTRKYTDEELLGIFADDARPVFVAVGTTWVRRSTSTSLTMRASLAATT